VIPEGNETHDGDPGALSEGGSARRSEGDLLAERRARRAAESGELALTRRAEAAEATVETLERHVASLQQRLRDAEDEQRLAGELLDAEKATAIERERELRRVKQREYAEQQLRVEAEERLAGGGRDGRAEIDRLELRLSSSEQSAAELAATLESLTRQLAEAQQALEAERALLRRGEQELHARMEKLEQRATELQKGLVAERLARERCERQLETMRDGYRQAAGLLRDVKGLVARLGAGVASASRVVPSTPRITSTAHVAKAPPPQQAPPARTRPAPNEIWPAPPVAPEPAPELRGAEMTEALAAAVERLRARAQEAPRLEPEHVAPTPARVPHKASLSLLGRWRMRRKQRRSS
jgi:hypothetical protein